MTKRIFTIALSVICLGNVLHVDAQSDKNKKSRYYQNNTTEPNEFNIEGFYREPDKKDVDKKTEEKEYDVKVKRNQSDSKYYEEKRVVTAEEKDEAPEPNNRAERAPRPAKRKKVASYPTTYGGERRYNENRNNYDKYYDGNGVRRTYADAPPPPAPVKPAKTTKVKRKQVEEREIGMTPNELEYKTTVVKKRYTNLDVLCDDLDLAKVQRPVFKGICTECSRDVDLIIVDKNMSSLEKNYNLKQCYMLRDKRLRETLDDDQYKKFLRVKDADEYLIITKDLELKDGVNR